MWAPWRIYFCLAAGSMEAGGEDRFLEAGREELLEEGAYYSLSAGTSRVLNK